MGFEESADLTDEILEEEAENAAEKMADDTEDEIVEECLAEEDEEEAEDADEKKSFFGKKNKKEKKDKKDIQIEELTDRVKRNMAEFDNYRKRTEKEKAAMFDMGARTIVEKILPVIDNFERGLAGVPEESRDDAFVDGMDRIYKQLMKTLEDAGVEAIPAVGEPFDLNLHNAVMHIEDENYGENIIVSELQKGYQYKGIVIRHSMVQVAN